MTVDLVRIRLDVFLAAVAAPAAEAAPGGGEGGCLAQKNLPARALSCLFQQWRRSTSASDHRVIPTLVFMCHPFFAKCHPFSASPAPRLDALTTYFFDFDIFVFVYPPKVDSYLFSVFLFIYLFFTLSCRVSY